MALRAWNMMGGDIDWPMLDWLVGYLGVDDLDALVLDLILIREWMAKK